MRLILRVTDAKGTRDIELEGHSTNNMYRAGYRDKMIQVGDTITVNVAPLKDGSEGGYVTVGGDRQGHALRRAVGRGTGGARAGEGRRRARGNRTRSSVFRSSVYGPRGAELRGMAMAQQTRRALRCSECGDARRRGVPASAGVGGGDAGRSRDGVRPHPRRGRGRHQDVQGHPLRRQHGRAQPLQAAGGPGEVDRRARCAGVWAQRAAAPAGNGAEHVGSGRGRRRHARGKRRLPGPERVDAGAERQPQAAGDGVVPRRRLRHRLRLLADHRGRGPGTARRRGGGDAEPPPQRDGLHLPRGGWAAPSSPGRATPACWTSSTR